MPRNIMRADNIRRLLFPDLAFIATTSSLICYYNQFLTIRPQDFGFDIGVDSLMMVLPIECFSLTTMALGLLVTFKTQTCYSRYTESRNAWGQIIYEARSLGSRILARVPSHTGSVEDGIKRTRLHALKLLRSLPYTFKYHLTEDGCNPHIEIKADTTESDIRAMTSQALEAELSNIWDVREERELDILHRLLESENRPLFVLHELSHINGEVFANPAQGGLHPVVSNEIDRGLTNLHFALTICEKNLRTPIYTPYTKFTSRFLFLWCNSLTLALFPITGPIGAVPVTLVISFFMLGIEDIGCRVEQPFDVLPLWQYCQIVDHSLEQLTRHSEMYQETEESFATYDALGSKSEDSLQSFVDPL